MAGSVKLSRPFSRWPARRCSNGSPATRTTRSYRCRRANAIAKAAVNVLGTADLIPIDAVKAHQFEMFECTI